MPLPLPLPSPRGEKPLVGLFRANWRRLTLTYTLFNVEYLLHLAQPLLLGMAINGLLAGRASGLAWLVAQHLAWLMVATARRTYDTRAFTAIYADMATELVCRQRQAGAEVSAVAARSALSRELVEFFEHDLKAVFAAAYGVIGALVLIAAYDPMVTLFCLATLGPLLILSWRLSRRSLALNGPLNDQLEREVGVIQDGRIGPVGAHYRLLARYRVRLSDMEAWNFFQMEFFVLGLIVASLARYCATPGVAAGDIYAVFTYILMFIDSLDIVPQVVGQLARLQDIGQRVGADRDAG